MIIKMITIANIIIIRITITICTGSTNPRRPAFNLPYQCELAFVQLVFMQYDFNIWRALCAHTKYMHIGKC